MVFETEIMTIRVPVGFREEVRQLSFDLSAKERRKITHGEVVTRAVEQYKESVKPEQQEGEGSVV